MFLARNQVFEKKQTGKIIENKMQSKNEVSASHLYESKLLVLEFIFDHFRRQIFINIERGPFGAKNKSISIELGP